MTPDSRIRPIEIFLTSEAFVLTYATAFLVMSTYSNLEQEFDYGAENLEPVTINGATFDQTPFTPYSLLMNKSTEVWVLDNQAADTSMKEVEVTE